MNFPRMDKCWPGHLMRCAVLLKPINKIGTGSVMCVKKWYFDYVGFG
jgi:hypothetical protein